MQIATASLERWMGKYYFATDIDIGSSGVQPIAMRELCACVPLAQDDLANVVFQDSETAGARGLREVIARRWGHPGVEHVMVTHGSSEAIFLLMHALLRPGGEVVVVDPCYQQLFSIAQAIGCRLKRLALRFEDGYVPDTAELRGLLTRRTRLLVLNFPHNPTGAAVSAAEQRELLSAAAEVGAYVLWDEAFAELIHDGPPLPGPARLYERCISIGTLSKAYGLPGLRVGWAIAPPAVLAECAHLRDYITLHLSPLTELIARHAIEHGDRLVERGMRAARANLQLLREWIDRRRGLVDWVPPRAGVSAFVRLNRVPDVDLFCARLAREKRVLLVPGSCFGQPRFVRLGFGAATPDFAEGLSRMSDLFDVSQGQGEVQSQSTEGRIREQIRVMQS